jgi:hypothetical protein
LGAGGAHLAGGWGAGAKPRMRDFHEFQSKIEKVLDSMNSISKLKTHEHRGQVTGVHGSPILYLNFSHVRKYIF